MSALFWWFQDNFLTIALVGCCVALLGLLAASIAGLALNWGYKADD